MQQSRAAWLLDTIMASTEHAPDQSGSLSTSRSRCESAIVKKTSLSSSRYAPSRTSNFFLFAATALVTSERKPLEGAAGVFHTTLGKV